MKLLVLLAALSALVCLASAGYIRSGWSGGGWSGRGWSGGSRGWSGGWSSPVVVRRVYSSPSYGWSGYGGYGGYGSGWRSGWNSGWW
ncbi:uncharacterized protein LOC106135704 [Amyelois transitella]|uniref:uncharacterized protein LOC106135704 n=1 Tax=Amyelois transitella TaxID=680683 RepID=UPI00067BE375|nr:uncharacterized protein LOC106135704 [Amyelois transitella]